MWSYLSILRAEIFLLMTFYMCMYTHEFIFKYKKTDGINTVRFKMIEFRNYAASFFISGCTAVSFV